MRSICPETRLAVSVFGALTDTCDRLRQTDVKAGHYERKVQALENARDTWENKYEEMAKKHADLQKELHNLETEIGSI